MINNPSATNTLYFVDTTKHFKIWFSDNPEVFLPQENQLRLIHMRANNPKAEIALIYYAESLSKKAQAQLHSF